MAWDESLINSLPTDEPKPEEGRVLGYAQAIQEALDVAMERDSSVLVLGQGATDPGAMFGVSKGLEKKYGSDRVFDTPVSEEGMTGVCVGAAMNGMRPVYLHNRADFILLTFNQLVNHASKIHYLDNGKNKVPLVVWSAVARGWGSGAQHSQAIHGLLMGIPGLKIVLPTTPFDAKGLMLSAIEDNNPVLIFEHRWLMKKKGVVPEGYYKVPLGKGVYRKRGSDLTIVAVSHTVDIAQRALEQLEKEGISADLIDLRSVKPIDEALILESLSKTGRLLVMDTAWMTAGLCAEVGFLAAEKGFKYLKAPIKRLGLPDCPTPAGFTLEEFIYPNEERVKQKVREMLK